MNKLDMTCRVHWEKKLVALVLDKDFRLQTSRGIVSKFFIWVNIELIESPSYKYNLPSEFDIGKPGTAMAGSMSKAGVYSFGISREYYKKVYVP